MTEKHLRHAVYDCARRLGWSCYWTWTSKHSPAGFPDMVLTRGGRLLFAELKVGRNRPTPAQENWLAALRAVAGVEVYLWREADWLGGAVEQILREAP